MARKHALPGNWLNDLIGDFVRGTRTAPEGTLWCTYTPLEVFIPRAEYILALKLFAPEAITEVVPFDEIIPRVI